MALRVENTLTGEREPFEPQNPDSVLLYYCGLTVSDRAHLGHARTWVHVDVMHRWLEWLGYSVRHVENFTDVNEKIVARVDEDDLGDTENAVASGFIAETLADMRALGLKRAEVYPRVSEHVPEIVALIETLIEKGYAYESNSSIYFDVTTFEEYGKLSNQRLDDIEAQTEADERAEKRHAADFALWKAGGVAPEALAEHRPADRPVEDEDPPSGQVWDSPWGAGRPGWHIECSAMSMAHLDDTIDIHVGGRDLVFPHHENEIAQSEASTGEEFSRYWLHADLFAMGDEKMSTSLGNFITVEDALAAYGRNAIRTFLLSGSYNTTQTYSETAIEEATERAARLERTHDRAAAALDSADAGAKAADGSLRESTGDTREAFEAAMNDDFNTRGALASLLELSTAVNRYLDGVVADEGEKYDYQGLKRAVETFEEFGGGVCGLVFGEDSNGADGDVRLADELVKLVLETREAERAAGNYDWADELRRELEALGVDIEDTDDGPTFQIEATQ